MQKPPISFNSVLEAENCFTGAPEVLIRQKDIFLRIMFG